jgi:hypothetical protein
MPIRLLIVLIALGAAGAARAQSCPDQGRYTTNGYDSAFCLYEPITLPQSSTVAPYCNYLQSGYIGFSWDITAATQNYQCPAGSYYSTNGAGGGFCIYSTPNPPAWATPYCDYLQSGYIGYTWRICPPGGTLTTSSTGAFCIWENLSLPRNAGAYCEYLSQGYFGFEYPLRGNYGYRCPSGFTQTTNRAGLGFCLVENVGEPSQVAPYCNYLSQGYIGYSWPL